MIRCAQEDYAPRFCFVVYSYFWDEIAGARGRQKLWGESELAGIGGYYVGEWSKRVQLRYRAGKNSLGQ